MKTKLTWAAVLSIVMIPLLSFGLLDPLEGLPLLILGLGIAVTVRLLSRVRLPRFTWVSFTVAASLMAVTLGIAIAQSFASPIRETETTVANPMAEGLMIGGMPVLILLLWIARFANLVMIAGLVIYSVRIFRARAATTPADSSSEAL